MAPTQRPADRPVSPALEAYLADGFDPAVLDAEPALAVEDEPFVATWAGWLEESRQTPLMEVLGRHLPQLAFPIRAAMGQEPAYRAATLRGVAPETLPEATGLPLEAPEAISLHLHDTGAGRVPYLVVRHRPDFVSLARALAHRNEPAPIPPSQGALIVSGYNNWGRLHALRRRWEAAPASERETATWNEELGRIKPRRELYQDRFLVLSDGPYSGVDAAELGLEDAPWRDLSLTLRLHHEAAHYFTRRRLGRMKNHALDELIADYAGITAARGGFRADWWDRFLGLDRLEEALAGEGEGEGTEEKVQREGEGAAAGAAACRLLLYRGKPPLGAEDLLHLRQVLRRAAAVVEELDGSVSPGLGSTAEGRKRMLLAIARVGLAGLAAPNGEDRLAAALSLGARR